jgi:hypothetical protein
VEGRQQQLALAHVPLLVEDEEGVAAEQRGEDFVALAGVERSWQLVDLPGTFHR